MVLEIACSLHWCSKSCAWLVMRGGAGWSYDSSVLTTYRVVPNQGQTSLHSPVDTGVVTQSH